MFRKILAAVFHHTLTRRQRLLEEGRIGRYRFGRAPLSSPNLLPPASSLPSPASSLRPPASSLQPPVSFPL